MTPDRATRAFTFALSLLLLAGCGNSQQEAVPAMGKTAADRPERIYTGAQACSLHTDVELVSPAGVAHKQTVCGKLNPHGTPAANEPLYVYLGIPYADSPDGPWPGHARRWTDPRPATFRDLSATVYGPRCPQGEGKDISTADVNEDCLYLNVWTPTITPTANLPVMVFIHGGAFISGSGGWARGQGPNMLNLYDGSQFVETARTGGEGVVFVTLNYRLGVLGFLAGDKIGLDGNFGIKDQSAALQWVNRNISRFGGDPANVTIFGESAGAQSTALHLTMPGDQPLFSRAVMESNYAIDYQTVAQAQSKANAFSVVTGCGGLLAPATDVACLRDLPLSIVLDMQTKGAWTIHDLECQGLQAIIPWNPVIDGAVIFQDPILANVTKPFMLGSNLTESIPFVAWMGTGGPLKKFALSTDAEWGAAYASLMLGMFGKDDAKAIVSEYAVYQLLNGNQATLETVVTDYLWTCFNRNFASTAPHAGVASFRYHDVHFPSFPNWVDSDGNVKGPVDTQCNTSPNVCHANELAFVFGNPTNAASQKKSFTDAEVTLSGQLQNYWIQFARTATPSDPNHPFTPGQTAWPLDSSGQLLQIQAPPTGMTVLDDQAFETTARCKALWDGIGYVVKSAASGTPACPVTVP
jgi:carboxylesterase type B